VFDASESQVNVFDATAKFLIPSVLEGFNATVFAYGQVKCPSLRMTAPKMQPLDDVNVFFTHVVVFWKFVDDRSNYFFEPLCFLFPFLCAVLAPCSYALLH